MQQIYSSLGLRPLGRGKSFVFAAAAALTMLLGGPAVRTSQAAPVVSLIDRNSAVTVNPIASAGIESWKVNGTNQLNQEWFWYSVGNSGGQFSVDSLGLTNSSVSDTNGDGQNDTAKLTYGSSHGLQVIITLSLTGGKTGSETSDLSETMKISNLGSSQMDYHFYEYTNFNLDDLTTGQTAAITGGNTATVTGNGMTAQTAVTPKPSEFDASLFPTLINHIASSTSYTLPDVAKSGIGDSEWAFQWNLTLCTGNCATICIDKTIKGIPVNVVPEPTGTAALASVCSLYVLAAANPEAETGLK